MRIKKQRSVCDALKEGAMFLLAFSFLFTICRIGYWCGYYGGKNDGYASGYINGTNGVYSESASATLQRNITSDLRIYVPKWSRLALKKIDLLFSAKPANADAIAKYDYLQIEDSVSSLIVAELVDALGRIPTELLNHYKQNGWVVIVGEEDIMVDYRGNKDYVATGYISYDRSTIILSTTASDLASTVAHEFGHYFDYISGRLSKSDEWRECYLAEWEAYYAMNQSFHTIGTTVEYFAGTFSMYIEQPNKLKEICPMSYQFIHEALSKFQYEAE